MRFLKLDLHAFGPFTDLSLDLSEGQHGLHIVYGANEAGKSSSLRAIADFLYGIPSRTSDNFLHPYPRLRIGATLQHSDGTTLQLVRRKAIKNSLFCGHDADPVDEGQLMHLLGDVERELFSLMFGIDHELLRRGGAEIAKGDGRIGQLLFAAGAGLAGLQSVRSSLQSEMDALLKPSGRSGVIATHIKQYQERRAAVKQVQVAVETWKSQDDLLRSAQDRKEALDNEISTARIELSRLIRIRDALSVIGQWKKAKADLAQVSSAALLPDDFDKTSNKILIDLRKAEQQVVDAETALAKVDRELNEIVVPQRLLEELHTAEQMRDRFGGYRKAMADRPKLETSKDLAESEAKEILRELGRSTDLSTVEELRLPTDKSVRIQNLAIQHEGLVQRVESSRREADKIRREIVRLEKISAEISVAPDLRSLRNAIREAQEAGDTQTQLESLATEVEQLQLEANLLVEQLGLWQGNLEEAEKLSVPDLATIEYYLETLKDQASRIKSFEVQLRERSEERQRLNRQLVQLESGRQVPTEEQLLEARRIRDEGWQLVVASWEQNSVDEKRTAKFIDRFGAASALRDAYPKSVDSADQIADQLRSDADRVATKASLNAEIALRDDECNESQRELDAAGEELRDAHEQWRDIWLPLGIEPLSPTEMRQWLRRFQEMLAVSKQLRQKRAAHRQLADRQAAMIERLVGALSTVGCQHKQEFGSLRQTVEYALNFVEEIQVRENRRDQFLADLAMNRRELEDAEARLDEAQQQQSRWQSAWAAEMAVIGLEPDALPSQANSVLAAVSRLFQKYHDASQLGLRLDGIDRDGREFSADLSGLIARVLPDYAASSVEETVSHLSAQLKAAQSAEQRRAALKQQQRELRAQRTDAARRVSEFTASLDEMCRQAGCQSHDELASAAARSARRSALVRFVNELEDIISSQSGGASFDEFVQDVASVEPDTLRPEIDKLEESVQRLSSERDDVIGQIKAATIELRKIDGGADASWRAIECESIAAQIEGQVQQLVRLRVCDTVLSAAIEEHRKRNQGPVLGRANTLFRKLTLGQFRELRADFNERGEPVLTGVRSETGESVEVSGMSDGTCDQLYLALRLASLEAWLQRHEPLPFIVDDILLNFDDDRAIACLAVLAELSQQTQVIFFTHHQHLVEMAQQHLPESALFVQSLDERGAPV